MGAKKKQKLMAMAEADLNTGLQAMLSDSGLPVSERAAAAGRVLQQPGLPAAVCRTALDWLMAQGGSSITATVLPGSLSLPGVQAAVEADPQMLDLLLPAAASAAAAVAGGEEIGASAGDSGSSLGQPACGDVSLDLSALPADRLIGPAAAAAGRALSLPDSPGSSAPADSAAGVPLLRRLCERLSSVTDPSESLRASYLARLLIPSLRLAASRPQLAAVVRGPFEAIALGAEGLSALSAAAAGKQAHETAEGAAKELLNALQNLSATDPTLGAELLALLAGILLREKTPLSGVTLLAKCLGISTSPPLEPSQETPPETHLTPRSGTDDVTVLSLPVRLGLLGRLARCLRQARVSLTSSAGGQTLLQWLRSAAAAAAASASGGAAAAAWYDCAAALLRVSPLVLPLQGRLGPVLVRALGDCHGKDADTAAAASRLVQLTISTYSELRQLPRLLPQLLLSARQLRTDPPQRQRKVKTRVLRLTAEQETLLAGQLSRLPQPHVPDVWKTLLYHLGEDGVAAMKRGDESSDSISPVLALTLQLVAVFLSHVAVVDQTTITAATRALLPGLMTQTGQTLQQVAAIVTRTHQSSDHVTGLLSACLAWRRLHTALLHYSAAYRAEMVTSPPDDMMTSPLAPLGEKRWWKLSKLEETVAAGSPCGQLMAEFVSEAAGAAPADWLPPGAGAGAAPVCRPGRPLSGASLGSLSASQLGRLVPSGAECRPLPLAVAALLADRLTALPSLGGKRKRDCGRPPQQLAAALRDAAAAALGADDASSPTPPPPPEEVWQILEEVGACLESAAGWTESSDEASQPHEDPPQSPEGETASLTRPLQLVLSLPLEHLSETAASLVMAVLCLCLLRIPAGGRGRELALSALSALLISAGCRRPLERIQPSRLFAWLAAAPPSLSPATLPSTVTELGESPPENGTNSLTNNRPSADLHGPAPPPYHLEPSPSTPHLSPCSSAPGSGGCAVSAARRALLLCYSGRRAALLAPAAQEMVRRLREADPGQGAVDALVELLQHFVQTNVALRGADAAVKQQAKSVSASLPRLLTDLPSTLATLALLVPLRAHKPPGSGRPPRWRRLLVEVFPAALEAARDPQEGEEERGSEGERGEREAARELLVAVCAARDHLKSELPPTFVMDVWRCVRACDVTADQLRTVLTSSDDSEMEQIVTELTDDTMSLPVDAPSAGRWRRLLVQWRALASCGQLPAAGRAQQRRGLTRLLRRLAGCTPQLAAGPEEVQQLLVPAVEAAAAAVAQKHVRLSDTAYTDSVQCCHLELASVATPAACGAIRAACDLLWQLVSGHPAAAATRLPLVTQVVQSLANEVCLRSVLEKRPTPQELALLVAAANRITRVVRQMVQLGPLSEPLAPYLIADLLTLVQRAPLDSEVQEAVTASMFCLLTQCRDEVITRLRVTLPTTVSHLFHTTVNTYKKFHKFVGRV